MRLAFGFPGSPVHSSTAMARIDEAAFLATFTWPGYCAQAGKASASSNNAPRRLPGHIVE